MTTKGTGLVESVKDGVVGAVKGSGNTAAVETVGRVVTQTISGVKVVLKEPFKKKEGA
jgi:hypothetical protein